MNIKNITLREMRQIQKEQCSMIALYEVRRIGIYTEIESGSNQGPGVGGSKGELLFTGYRVSV